MELLTDRIAQFLSALGFAVRVFLHVVKALFAFQFHDHASCDQFHLAPASGEVQIFAVIHDRRAGGAHMHFLCPVLI